MTTKKKEIIIKREKYIIIPLDIHYLKFNEYVLDNSDKDFLFKTPISLQMKKELVDASRASTEGKKTVNCNF
jgi:hypothetical protein